MEEQSLRQTIPILTRVREGVSQAVREQYEKNPYPRWIKTNVAETASGTGLRLNLVNYEFPGNPEILNAGCGTGQQPLATATSILGSNILAVDLSLSSLAYAKRKTHELGVSNIDYAQADILELEGLDRRFDLVECGGVLHHLEDPLAGWRVLVNLLRPGGFMQIALYSETARQLIVKARGLIAERGYTPSSNDIRRFRQDLMTKDEDPEILKLFDVRDFYSLSECRDLLFHVQEHLFTIPQIENALEFLELKFLGFKINDPGVLRNFTEANQEHQDLTSLSRWHEFEIENPDTFLDMYRFWCKKM
jgi:2-polyprenyl-3-methyl-5-hydroxy-6-metoxy-1,4-benzoquinol methylase